MKMNKGVSAEPGDVIEIVVEGLGFRGEGYYRPSPGRFISVPHTLPGDRLNARIGSWHRGRAFGEVVEVLESSTEHVDPDCYAYQLCSGCALRHMSLEAERRWKLASLREILERYAGGALSGLEVAALPATWVGVPSRRGHRSRGKLRVAVGDGGVRLGLGGVDLQREVVDIRRCPAQTPRFVAVVEVLAAALDRAPEAAATLETVAVSIGADDEALITVEGGEAGRELLASAVGEIANARLAESNDDRGLTLGHGVVAPLGSWVPANPSAAVLMVDWVMATLGQRGPHRFVLDLCCGLGTVTARLAEHAQVLAVDRDHRATTALKAANLANVTVRTGAVGTIIRKLRRELGADRPTAAVINPMRRPLGAQLDALHHLGIDHVLYLGPSPVSAARDASRLAMAGGYRLRSFAAVDLHPGTSQVMLALELTRDQ